MPDAGRPWRCFVAVPLGAELRAVIERCARSLRLRTAADAWRWTDEAGWHVTLAFLGATDPVSVPAMSAGLDRVAGEHAGFALEAGGLGAFPSRRRARVLWFGVADPDGRLRRLALDTGAALGVSDETRFRAHVTLARARERFGADASELLTGCPERAILPVERLVLYRSHLGRGPARYEALHTATLRRADA